MDTHFLIDNAHPQEVKNLLRCLDREIAYSNEELRHFLLSKLNYHAQRNLSFSTRRLYDLGFVSKQGTPTGRPGYVLTNCGTKVRNLLEIDCDLFADIMHYSHYDGLSSDRKLFWSYRCCCNIVWKRQEIPLRLEEVVAEVQSQIAQQFDEAYSQKIGGNFNVGGVTAWKAWIDNLPNPPFRLKDTGPESSVDDMTRDGRPSLPVRAKDRKLHFREHKNFEVVLLALDHVYRVREYRCGDPVVLDEQLIDEIARVFFLSPDCCRRLLDLAGRITHDIQLRETFAGTAVTLVSPYTIERVLI